jgi:hypothetical protein
VYWVGQWAQEGYGNSNNGIHPKHQRSHQLRAGEIPSVESSVMSRNMAQAQAGQLREKVLTLTQLYFSP